MSYPLLKNLLNKHLSLAIIVMGAGTLFISNILLKDILNPTDYGNYSIVITFFSLMYLFGALGSEQIILRYSFFNEKKELNISKSHFTYIVVILTLTSLFSSIIIFYHFDFLKINFTMLFLSSFSMSSLLIVSNIFRLNSNFNISQFVSNFWKIALIILSLYFLFSKRTEFDFLFHSICISIISSFVLSILVIIRIVRLNFIKSSESFFTPFVHYFIAIFTFTTITFADRFLIENKFSIEAFGEYFFLANFFLAPFSILQNYVGFKQLVLFKSNFSIKFFKRQNIKAIGLGGFLGFILLAFLFIFKIFRINKFEIFNQTSLVILLIITGIIRIYSSSVLSGFEAIVSVETLKKSNLRILIVTFAVLGITFIWANSMEAIVFSVSLIWLFRTWIQKGLIVHQYKNTANEN